MQQQPDIAAAAGDQRAGEVVRDVAEFLRRRQDFVFRLFADADRRLFSGIEGGVDRDARDSRVFGKHCRRHLLSLPGIVNHDRNPVIVCADPATGKRMSRKITVIARAIFAIFKNSMSEKMVS